ncbi:hypothetical protein P5673_016699 [Acropora cervicornis]|uniref:Uncharacterized protein n=1 Tax=Acropora cervicornis TaxID=6130 RepID=A0AAD9QFT6_ACRCE|nr:hypothetical protein P5673_016699 [Acropora cervicornis]
MATSVDEASQAVNGAQNLDATSSSCFTVVFADLVSRSARLSNYLVECRVMSTSRQRRRLKSLAIAQLTEGKRRAKCK